MNDHISYTFFHGNEPDFQIKGDYIYTFDKYGDVYGMSLSNLNRLIIEHGTKIEEGEL